MPLSGNATATRHFIYLGPKELVVSWFARAKAPAYELAGHDTEDAEEIIRLLDEARRAKPPRYYDLGEGFWFRKSDNKQIYVNCVPHPTNLWYKDDEGEDVIVYKEELDRDYHR